MYLFTAPYSVVSVNILLWSGVVGIVSLRTQLYQPLILVSVLFFVVEKKMRYLR